MLKGKRVFAIIPARGGSKGIPGKNLYKIGNETLLERTIRLAKSCNTIDHIIVSTDQIEAFEIAKHLGVNSPNLRPAHLATDNAKTIDVILYHMLEYDVSDDYILLLQTTSPLRTKQDLENIFTMLSDRSSDADSVVSLTAFDNPHPNKIQSIENGYVRSYLKMGESMVARQTLPKVFRLNGAFYLATANLIKENKSFFSDKTIPYIMPEERSLNLDTMYDLFLLEALIAKGKVALIS